ncbi:BON domain-containing protein [Ideonella sp. A 288]|uniref:BON domain-containing protein n=1 Tax=Ideonella sp. A 288 TaxID=1962181 RepID=UPI000B4BEFE1|nr:BON domain-containing protein [Ideonella sp. A 288]
MTTRTSRLLLGTALTAIATTLLMGCNKAPEAAPATQAPPMTVGTQVDDAVITSSVKSALLAEPAVNSFDLQVETRKGTVQLSGFVDSQAQIDQALAVTRSVAGVTNVENGVTLKGTATSMGTKVDDATVTGRVKTALLADPDIKSLDISVVTYKGEVQLSGFVNSQGQIDQANKIAGAADGASSVKNELKVKQ